MVNSSLTCRPVAGLRAVTQLPHELTSTMTAGIAARISSMVRKIVSSMNGLWPLREGQSNMSEDPGGNAGRGRLSWASAASLGWLLAASGVVGVVYGAAKGTYDYIAAGAAATATRDANIAVDKAHAVVFEVSVDQRLKDAVARVDGLAAALHMRIDDLNKRIDARYEARTAMINALELRVSGLEIKVCYQAGVRIKDCK